ncbi:MAG: polymer-forming cytoskeletal protein, partial [Crocinitomicaceae bacterium]|nr:polymer-forming cytoskeletal protein [Crocinitomicaceae bacterium]
GLLSLRSTASIIGEITTAKLEVEEGAEFSGNCVMSNQKNATTASTRTVKEDVLEDNLVY